MKAPAILVDHVAPHKGSEDNGPHVQFRLAGHRYQTIAGSGYTGFRLDGTYFQVSGIIPAAELPVLVNAHEVLIALEELVEQGDHRGFYPEFLDNARAVIAKARGQA